MDTTPFKELIREKTGICFDRSRADLLSDEIQSLMSGRGLKSLQACYDLLCRDPDEFFRFLNLLTVNETYFFREPVHLRLFSERLIPQMLSTKAEQEKIRILSAGCSTGEEPYSLAIILHQKYGADAPKFFSITAADIDTQAIRKAREGIYTARAFRTAGAGLKTSYFTDLGNGRFQIHENIRSRVSFHTLNLLSVPYPEPLRANDIVFYRNVSIYFDSTARRKIFRNLADILKPGGYLIVSSTETLSHDYRILNLMERDGVFLFCKSADRGEAQNIPSSFGTAQASAGRKRDTGNSIAAALQTPAPLTRQAVSGSPGSAAEIFPSKTGAGLTQGSDTAGTPRAEQKHRQNESSEQLHSRALSLARHKAYAKALEVLDELLGDCPSSVRAKTLQAEILFNMGQTDAAEQLCTDVLETDPLCLEACVLLGLIAKSRQQAEEALKSFRQAIYIRSSAWLPHFHTAGICQSRGEDEKAMREYAIVIRLISSGGFGVHGLSFVPFSFSDADILHLCRHNTEKIRNSRHQTHAKEKIGGI